MSELLPCPFCGLVPELTNHIYGDTVVSHKPSEEKPRLTCFMGNTVEKFHSREYAISEWNRRRVVSEKKVEPADDPHIVHHGHTLRASFISAQLDFADKEIDRATNILEAAGVKPNDGYAVRTVDDMVTELVRERDAFRAFHACFSYDTKDVWEFESGHRCRDDAHNKWVAARDAKGKTP